MSGLLVDHTLLDFSKDIDDLESKIQEESNAIQLVTINNISQENINRIIRQRVIEN